MEKSHLSISDYGNYGKGYTEHVVNIFSKIYVHRYNSRNSEEFYNKQYVYSIVF